MQGDDEMPAIVRLAREGVALTPLQAVAGKLWVAHSGADADGAATRAIEEYWRAAGGDDAYWRRMDERMSCNACGEVYKLENLAVCPNCFSVRCYRHDRLCTCGFAALG
jgi:hypothetical protein